MLWRIHDSGFSHQFLVNVVSVITVLWSLFTPVHAQVLNPPLFNLAESKRISATSTCGESRNGRPIREMYCFLAGATAYTPFAGLYSYENDFAELRIGNLINGNDKSSEPKNVVEGGQNCEFCDSSVPELSHPAENMVDGTPHWWQSPPLSRGMEYNQVNITIYLEQEFHVAYVSILMANSPRPGLWVLERSTDYGKTYKPWQYFAENPSQCEEFFGPDALQPILDDDSVICSTDYSQIVPLENGEIIITLLNNRPNRGNFSHSEKLQEFTQATNVRIRLLRTKTLQGHLMDLNDKKDPTITRRYFYAIKEIEMGGRCVCHGHAKTCDILDQARPDRLLCRCEHNTCGDQCEICCPGYEQKKWQPTREQQVFQCERCNCFGHSEECYYDEKVDQQRLSIDINGNYIGGGVCKKCRDNTAGINCNKCLHGYYRPYGRPLNATNVCEPCVCNPHYHTGFCEDGNGQCVCRSNFEPPDCRSCSKGYYDYPYCKPCDCNINGTLSDVCLPEDGACPCKPNYAGTFCDTCVDGTFQFPDCIECQCEDLGAVSKNCSKQTGHCQCKINYGGKSCELCADGYFRHPTCSYCDCDHSGTEKEVCDKTSGECFCKAGYAGQRCDRCNDTYYGYPDCKPCDCDAIGSIGESCNPSMGQCQCKPNFTGRRCNKCSAGYYDYPRCLACDCDRSGSWGITCNDNGLCFCKSNFDGPKCDVCKTNFYNYPVCEECNCDPRGVSQTFYGCDRVPIGELCSCKERVIGRICNECKPTYWNLQYFNPLGCEECGCYLSGTLSSLSDCDDISGQCQCKAHVSGRNCTQCKAGFYNLQTWNHFGCEPCNCDIGGSFSSICDSKTGQCRCKPRITGRNCTEPIDMHYFPTLMHLQYEAEDGRTPDNRPVRFAIDPLLFANFSWRGFAVFSPIQDKVLLDVDIQKPSLYRLVFRYVNPTMNDIPVLVKFEPTYTYSQDDVKQSIETKLPVSKDPKSLYISKSGSPYPFVLNPGRWTLHIESKQRLFLDYLALFPSAYFEGSVLRHDIRNPCLIEDSGNTSCKQYSYPTIHFPRTTAGGLYYEADEAKKAVPIYANDKMLAKHGQTAHFDKNTPYMGEISTQKPGNYVVVIDYANFFEEIYPAVVDINTQNTKVSGTVTFHNCPYSELCREVVSHQGQPLNVPVDGNSATVAIKPTENINIALGGIVAIPQPEWSVDYLLPKYYCTRKNGKCHGSDFLMPPNAARFDVENNGNKEMSLNAENLPYLVADNNLIVLPLSANNTLIEVQGKVPSTDHYVLVIHYYNPTHANVHIDTLLQNDRLFDASNASSANAYLSLPFCPSVSGCRAVIRRKSDGAVSFEISDRFVIKFFLKNPAQATYLDYVLSVPWNSYGEDLIEPILGERSSEFLTKCSHLLLDNNASRHDDYCKKRIFSLASDYNMGAFSCGCNEDGSTSFVCDSFGGQCPCKPHVIGRQCTLCEPGYFGFPICQPCNCLTNQQCDPRNGQCLCPLHVEGQQCDKCKPYAFGYDSLIGCQECECKTEGTVDGTLECDQLLGQCKCKQNVGGRKCDKCLEGFYGFPYCYRCSCELAGSSPQICDQNTAQCVCKENVHGQLCESCVPGTFHLEERNPKGCTECFCFGVTSQCRSAEYVKYAIMNMKGWSAENSTDLIEEQNYVEFRAKGPTGGDSLSLSRAPPEKPIYFSAPSTYLGKLLYSYGGKLVYTVSSSPADDNSYRSVAADVILKGHNETVEYWADELPADPKEEFHVSVDLIPEKWRKPNGAFVTRPLLMLILNDVTTLLIKASYFDRISSAKLSRVLLDSASEERNLVGDIALNIELCSCPHGYTGSSCEECADGYYRVQSHGTHLGSCVACKCNGHSQRCDRATGRCFDCQHNTVGEHCETCDAGYYGDATRGHPEDCRLCPCPHASLQNNFAMSCSINLYGHLESCACRPGYAGVNCDRCATGWFGDPMRHGDFCRPCFCNENNNLTVPGSCDPLTGVCSLCERHTMGNACEICETWFYGDAMTSKNCRDCTCNRCGTHHCDNSQGTCHCKPNVNGENCDRCLANAYGFNTCHGCRMCDCAIASISTQCDYETGKCHCQPGATGQRCEHCEQGYWNYRQTGCIKCDCEADLSLGTVCDVRTGQCHCMDGATGPRCDQCLEGYLRLPEFGCRFCDQCVHVLVSDLDNLRAHMMDAEQQLSNVSIVYLTTKRLNRINSSYVSINAVAEPIIKESNMAVINRMKPEFAKLKSSADDVNIKTIRTEGSSNSTEERVKQLEDNALAFNRAVHEKIVQVQDFIRHLEELSESLGQGSVTTQLRESFISNASALLESMKNMNLEATKADSLAKLTEAEETLTQIKQKTNQSTTKERIDNISQIAQKIYDNLRELHNNVVNSSHRAYEADQFNDLTKKHPFYDRGINVDRELKSSENNTKNATDYLTKSRNLLLDAHDYFKEIEDLNKNVSGSVSELNAKVDSIKDGVSNQDTLRWEVANKQHQLQTALFNITSQFAGAKSDSHRAIQAAESYQAMASAMRDANEASSNALTKSADAEQNVLDIVSKHPNATVISMDLLRLASAKRSQITNELKKNLTTSKNQISSVNDTLKHSLNALEEIERELAKLRSDDKDTITANIVRESKDTQDALKSHNDKIADILADLPKLREKVHAGVTAGISAEQDIKGAATQIELLREAVPIALAGYEKVMSLAQMSSVALANVTNMLENLRSKIAKVRDVANRVKVGAEFFPNSSLQLQNPQKFGTSAHTVMSLYFKTREPNGLLLFVGNEAGTAAKGRAVPTDDFMALEVENGKAKLTYDLGAGETSIYSNKIVSDDHWHKAKIERTGKLAALVIESEDLETDQTEGFSIGTKSILNLSPNHSKFYVGGVPVTARMPRGMTNRHFVGKVEEVSFQGQPVGLWNFALDGRVDTYGTKERSELKQEATDSGGVRLNGEGYVEMNRGSWNPRKDASIRFSFKTFSPYGLLFYVGKDKDFLATEIRNGKVFAHYNLGSGVAQVMTPKSYNDGLWHAVEFARLGKAGKLIMDMEHKMPYNVTSPGLLADLDVTDVYYVGGLKYDVPQKDLTRQSFQGCIDKLKLNDQLINLANHKSAAFVEIGCPEKAVRVISFEQNFDGGVEFPSLTLGTAVEITFKFKTTQRDAMLLLLADDKLQNVFAVTLESGILVLSSISGQTPMSRLKMDYRDLSDGNWHYVTATRDNTSMKLDVDDLHTESGELNVVVLLPSTEATLYFGKIPPSKSINGNLAARALPFVGCLGDVTFNKRLFDFTNASRSVAGVSLLGCPIADPPAISNATGEGSNADFAHNMILENATIPKNHKLQAAAEGCIWTDKPASAIPADLAGDRFGVTPFSRFEFNRLPEAFDTKSEFSIQFRATASNGVIFYAVHRSQTDYVVLFMKNGFLTFSFDSGSGSVSLTTKRRYVDFQWHTIIASRDGRHANLSVDGIVEARGDSPGATYAIDTERPFFVGGLSQDIMPIVKKTFPGISPTFGGCLRDFKINRALLVEHAASHNVERCSMLTESGLFFGLDGGYSILNHNFYVGPTFSLEMDIKPKVKEAVLLSIAADNKGDYLVLQMTDGLLKFTVDNGAGPQSVNLSLQQAESVCDGHWHSVKVYKTKNVLTLSIDGSSKFFVIRQIKSTDTNTNNAFYLGGVPDDHVNRGLETRSPFYGCIKNIKMAKKARRKKDLDISSIAIHGDIQRSGCPLN